MSKCLTKVKSYPDTTCFDINIAMDYEATTLSHKTYRLFKVMHCIILIFHPHRLHCITPILHVADIRNSFNYFIKQIRCEILILLFDLPIWNGHCRFIKCPWPLIKMFRWDHQSRVCLAHWGPHHVTLPKRKGRHSCMRCIKSRIAKSPLENKL